VGASPTSVLGGTISFDAATQRLTYTADADVLDLLTAGQTRTDSFTYTVSDGHGGVVTATASVTVTGVASGLALVGGSGADVLAGTFEDDTMRGDAGNDTLLGGAGHDQLDGGTGRDRLEGGEGDDRFIVDGAGDAVVERGTAARTRWTQASASRWALGSRTSC
jgi:VCBS repeat-containing protein